MLIPFYEDHPSVASVLKGHELVISTIAGAVAQKIDPLLLSAAISAGVQRFMPSEYTLDVMHLHAIDVAGSTVLAGRIRNARELQLLAINKKY